MSMFEDANRKQISNRRKKDLYLHLLFIAATSIGIIALMALLINIVLDGIGRLNLDLFTNYPSRVAERAGMKSAIVGSIYMVLIMALYSTEH